MPDISVIICTHNPRRDYLLRVLEALKAQTLPREKWELLLIDNASKEPLEKAFDLSWHSHGRVIREEALGLTPARLCGISEAKSEVLVFVDDDNVLPTDYLETSLALATAWPVIGAWSGTVVAEYEVTPPLHLAPYLRYLCIRKVEHDFWGNNFSHATSPYGAGMGVRKTVAMAYLSKVRNDKRRLGLGRRGTSLMSSEDRDLASCTIDLGLGVALFSKLSLTHLIPAKRLTDDYLVELIKGTTTSDCIEEALRGEDVFLPKGKLARLAAINRYLRSSRFERRVQRAQEQGLAQARKYMNEYLVTSARTKN